MNPVSGPRAGHDLLAAIGHTPLIEIPGSSGSARLFGKLEYCNPGGSLKDRPVGHILAAALASGALAGGRRVVDASTGSAGVSYAMLGAALQIPVTLAMPGNASRECLERIRAHGAELILTDPVLGYNEARAAARRLATAHPERYWHSDLRDSEENWRAHHDGTGAEVLEQLAERGLDPPDTLLAGVGSGGTLGGLARRLKAANPALRVVAVVPDDFPGIAGLAAWKRPEAPPSPQLHIGMVDEISEVRLEEALARCRRLARQGLFVGPSAGACVEAAGRLRLRGKRELIVTVLGDGGGRYMAAGMWSRCPDG